MFTLTDPRIDEASGIAVSLRSRDVLYVQNDGGDSARFFALDAQTGRTRAVCLVDGAQNVDWEDIAAAPDARGVLSVWIADIGDNAAQRRSITVYRVDEPAVDRKQTITTSPPEVWRLRYPDRPHDAEAIAIDSTHKLIYLTTKSSSGKTDLYAVPMNSAGGRVQTLDPVGSVQLTFTGTPGGPNVLGQLAVTGGAMSVDGRRFVLRTYTDAYLWTVTTSLADALSGEPVQVPLPQQPLGEGITFGGKDLLIDSEKVGSAVYRLPVPSAVSTSPAQPTSVAAQPTTQPSSHSKAQRSAHSAVPWLILGGSVATAGLGYLIVRRRRIS
jgi:hypothetical protein